MPHREDLGFQSLPENGLKIVRARTLLGNLRLWEIPRSEQALETVVEEIGRSPIPGLYVLLDERAEKRGRLDDEVFLDDARKILIRRGFQIQQWGEKYATIDNQPVIIRPGSEKPKGWQVTFRGSKSLAQLRAGEGFLLMNRGGLVFLPLCEVRDFILSVDAEAFQRDTIDVFLRFEEERIVLVYKTGEKDVTRYSVEPYPPASR